MWEVVEITRDVDGHDDNMAELHENIKQNIEAHLNIHHTCMSGRLLPYLFTCPFIPCPDNMPDNNCVMFALKWWEKRELVSLNMSIGAL